MQRHLKNYKINPNIRKMIEEKIGKKPMSYMMIENLVKNILKGKYKKGSDLLDEDKEKIIGLLKMEKYTPNGYSDEINDNLATFLKDHFTEDESTKFVKYLVDRYYKPGETYNHVRISNNGLLKFLDNFSNIEKVSGIIINSEFIGDIKKIYDEVKYDEETLELTDDKVNDKVSDFVNNIIDKYGKHVDIYNKDGIYVITTTNPYVKISLEDTKLKVFENLPKYYFEKWKESSIIDVKPLSTLEKINIESDTDATISNVPPTDIPTSKIFETSEPIDILIDGAGYGSGLEFMDDFYSVTLKHNGKSIKGNFETDGGLHIHPLSKPHSPGTGEYLDEDDVENCGVDFLILRNFMGDINMTIKVDAYDDDDNKHTFYETSNGGDIYYDMNEKYEKLGYGDVDVDITIDIIGTFDKSEKLTKDIYNSL